MKYKVDGSLVIILGLVIVKVFFIPSMSWWLVFLPYTITFGVVAIVMAFTGIIYVVSLGIVVVDMLWTYLK